MTKIRGQISEVSSQKSARGLTLSPLPFALSLVGAMLFALCFSVQAQETKKIPQIGLLTLLASPDPLLGRAFRAGFARARLH